MSEGRLDGVHSCHGSSSRSRLVRGLCGEEACIAQGTALTHTSVSGLLSLSAAGHATGILGILDAASGRGACAEGMLGLRMQLHAQLGSY